MHPQSRAAPARVPDEAQLFVLLASRNFALNIVHTTDTYEYDLVLLSDMQDGHVYCAYPHPG